MLLINHFPLPDYLIDAFKLHEQFNIHKTTNMNATFSGFFASSDFTDEEKASGFTDSKAQRERFAKPLILHSSSTGKEKDSESGYHYFGARYYDSELLTSWMSVDPMSDKYPSVSPYAYCAWNPVLFVDPNGEEKIISFVKNKRNDKIKNAAERYKDNEPVIHLWAHGSPNYITVCGSNGERKPIDDATKMTDFLSTESMVFNANQKNREYSILVLHSCETGQGDNSIAQKFSQDMNLLVVAPTETVVVLPGYNQDPDGLQYEHGVNKGGFY